MIKPNVTTLFDPHQTFLGGVYVITILHSLHRNESVKIWVLIRCNYWSFVCSKRCEAFYKNNNNLPIQINLQMSLILTILHFLHKNQRSKIWVLIEFDYWSFVPCNTRCQAFNNINNKLPIPINLQLIYTYLLFCTFCTRMKVRKFEY